MQDHVFIYIIYKYSKVALTFMAPRGLGLMALIILRLFL